MTPFEALSARRRAFIDAARDNGFEEGLRKLLAELYPDTAHFIYELLQNAEDAGAQEVIFDLQQDGLRVKHNGTRLFDLKDITSITGIGQSPKADDETKIGKFGVGFKAVFAYTQTPAIHSGEYSFTIHDLFVPALIDADRESQQTTFWFPFNRTEKPAQQAVKEVGAGLRQVSDTSLLFLTNIRSIRCSLPNGDTLQLKRHDVDEHIIRIDTGHDDSSKYWYRITGEVQADGKTLTAAAAFALEPHAGKEIQPKSYTVKPIRGQVFIYFPAVKETSGLKFHIHAPFASTVARDSVRDDPGNDTFVATIADLVTGALPRMRDAGLITDDLLGALPNNRDELPDRYERLRTDVIEAFCKEPLTPMMGRGYAPSVQLLRSHSSIRTALSVEDANFLRGFAWTDNKPRVGWLRSPEGRAGHFLSSLRSVQFDHGEVSTILSILTDLYTKEDASDRAWQSWNEWIATKSDVWMRQLYIVLGALPQRAARSELGFFTADQLRHRLSTAPIVRVQHCGDVQHVPGEGAYLPTTRGLHAEGLVVDALAVFPDATSNDPDREALRAFYNVAQVKTWNAAARLDINLSAYNQHAPAVTKDHLEDLRVLQQLIDSGAVATDSYRDKPVFAAVRHDGTCHWAAARDLYLDDPFVTTGMSALYRSPSYRGQRPSQLVPDYIGTSFDTGQLARRLGATAGFSVAQIPIWRNLKFDERWRRDRENDNMISQDWEIPHFRVAVATGNESLLRTLWKTVSLAKETCADAMYRSNRSTRLYKIESQLLQALRSTPWILDRDGNLRRPEDITAEHLAEGLHLPSSAPLLDRAGFGKRAAADAQRQQEDADIAKRFEFESPEEMRRIADLRKRNPDKFKALIESMDAELSLPEAASGAPDHRARRARELSADAPTRRYAMRLRSVLIQEPGHLSAMRHYLRRMYTNEHGVLICQVCHHAMPFKIPSGEDYFEAVQFIKGAARELQANRLALCPTCAAKYHHALGTSRDQLRNNLLNQNIGRQASVTIAIQLASKPATIRFVGTHAIDLQNALDTVHPSVLEGEEQDTEYDDENGNVEIR
ncbi:sacsin N-terminal ATP-binding-like domain-containing protein [Catellatospora chokoriensis]|uniref:Sacsin/Nov domain-containing protein n=1 Tax=Catellatospora chokoriensis TaxID=310353 RepID=A0A8J3K8Q1_9ACTN|nr:hypothetical protein [Catellatospora chokoriensis]GIF91519.1 hypothetical protein Cch02nite_49630 [Catellatospora chokoriensis]